MTFEERVRLLARLDGLIKMKYRGNARDYAGKLGVSRATFFRLLIHIKNSDGRVVYYNKYEGYYQYA